MTQEEKARAYDEALDRCKEWVSGTWGHSVDDTPKDVAEFIFPQLAESEDEKMVVKIARTLSFAAAHNLITDYDELIAMQNWLEKQKEPHYTKRNALFDKCVENCDPKVMKSVSDKIDEMLEKEQKSEWSDEDEEVMEDLYNFVISGFIQDHIHETRWKPWKTTLERNRQNRLKSLRPSWKPSEGQMEALNALNCHGDLSYVDQQNQLISLYNDLKKLM